MGTGLLTRRYSSRGVMLTTHHLLEPRLSMSGATPLLPLYAFLAWSGIKYLLLNTQDMNTVITKL
jgi:hypothetical protein